MKTLKEFWRNFDGVVDFYDREGIKVDDMEYPSSTNILEEKEIRPGYFHVILDVKYGKKAMTIQELEKFMKEHGVALRAIPLKGRVIYAPHYKDEYPDGKIMYLEEPYNREMLVVEFTPPHAGKFLIESVKGTSATVWFTNRYFDSIEDAVEAVLSGEAKSPNTVGAKYLNNGR